MSTPYNYRDKLIGSGARIQLGLEDTIEITSSAELFVSGGSTINPSSILLTAVLRGTFKNILPSSIIWKRGGTQVSTGSTLTQSPADAGFTTSSSSSSVTYTAEVTLGYGALAQTVVASKVISLSVPTVLALVSPSSVSVSTAADGTGGTWGQLLTTTVSVGDSVSAGWLYSWTPSSGVSGSSSGNTYTISGMSVDSGTVTCTASKSGFTSRVVIATISKSRTGAIGPTGAGIKLVYIRSSGAPGTPAATTDPNIPPGWSTTTPGAGTGLIYASTGNRPSGSTTWTWLAPVLMEGQNGTPGTNGQNGKKTSTGYVYYSISTVLNPGTPYASSYNFSNDTFSGLSANWSTTPPAALANLTTGGGQWWAARYSVEETSAGSGTGTPTFAGAFTSILFNGLVTFTNVFDTLNGVTQGSGTTTIDGGKITAGTLVLQTNTTGNRIVLGRNTDTTAPNTITGYDSSNAIMYRLTTSSSYSLADAVMYVGSLGGTNYSIAAGACIAASSSQGGTFRTGYLAAPIGFGLNGPGVYGANNGAGNGVEAVSLLGNGVRASSSNGNGVYSTSTNGYAGNFQGTGGIVGQAAYDHGFLWANGSNAGWALIASAGRGCKVPQGYATFTGVHEALIPKNTSAILGDIVIDIEILTRKDVSNAFTKVDLPTIVYDRAAIGVLAREPESFNLDSMPDSLHSLGTEYSEGLRLTDNLLYEYNKNINNTLANQTLIDTCDYVTINLLGEGQVNVCGEGGDLEVGDLIVTSSIPGKGMKQADDIVRSYTVAKCRENVTFSLPTEVKMVACIYLCG